jgi:protocatechuate 3,4-dioxygenase beta subunit
MEIWQADTKGRYEGRAQCRGYFKTNNSVIWEIQGDSKDHIYRM